MSKITNSIKQLWAKFHDKDYRDGFLDDTIADSLAVQIQSMRQSLGWTQEYLAQRAGTKQAGVCRWENSEPPASLLTLKKIASAFDVALVVRFVPFSVFLVGDGDAVDRAVPSFDHDRLPSPTLVRVTINPVRSKPRFYPPGERHRSKTYPIMTSIVTENRTTLQ